MRRRASTEVSWSSRPRVPASLRPTQRAIVGDDLAGVVDARERDPEKVLGDAGDERLGGVVREERLADAPGPGQRDEACPLLPEQPGEAL